MTNEYYFVFSNDNGFKVIGKVFKATFGEAWDKASEMVKGLNIHHWDVSGSYDNEIHAHQTIKMYQEAANA